MVKESSWRVRGAGLLLLVATAWYLPWMLANLNWGAPWLAIPFAGASLLTALLTVVTLINHWTYSVPGPQAVAPGDEPAVATIIPTVGEPPEMVYRTGRSVLAQDYPPERIVLVISDDAHRPVVRAVAEQLQQEFPQAQVCYHEPPRRGDPARRGEAKAGNLNSALDALQVVAPAVAFVETRDADDLVGDPAFLRQVVGQLLANPRVAFVQTIKEAEVSPGDPFGNLEPLFYRRAMLARNSVNAVFPCGSGLCWRREALDDIGGFPAWNLVEDLQSGVEALRRGWRGVYLPIVGAMGQTAPEDLPNSIKQRGTWAVDTLRLTFWGKKKGLSLRQNLQFSEMGFFYLLSFAVLVFALVPVLALTLDIYPLVTRHLDYAVRFWPYAAAVELFLAVLAQGLSYESLWRARQTWLGMAPVFVRAALVALRFGPGRKPAYRVTRKEHKHGWYWRMIVPQLVLFFALIAASLYHLATHSLLLTADLGSLFWAAFFVLGLSRIVRNSWHGLAPGQAVIEWLGGVWRRVARARGASAQMGAVSGHAGGSKVRRTLRAWLVMLVLSLLLGACSGGARDADFAVYLTEAATTIRADETVIPAVTAQRATATPWVTGSVPAPAAVPTTAAHSGATAAPSTAAPVRTDTPAPAGDPPGTAGPVAAATVAPTVSTPSETLAVAPLNPAGRVGLGAYLDGTPYDGLAAVGRLEGLIGHRLEYVLWFQAWGDSDSAFLDSAVRQAAAAGYVPIITWEPWQRDFANPAGEQPAFSLQSIADGEHDAYIVSWAQAAAATGVPIILRFAHEQSTEPGVRSWYPWQGQPQAYRDAFRHVVAVFRAQNADKVEFLWSAMWLDSWAAQYYPGDDVVDYVGTTVLNHGTAVTTEWASWRTFDELFATQYQTALGWAKPIIVTEVASAEQGGDKAAWLGALFSSLEPRYALVRGVLLLEVQSDREWPAINWSVGSSPETLAVVRQALTDPYFR